MSVHDAMTAGPEIRVSEEAATELKRIMGDNPGKILRVAIAGFG